MGGIMRKKGKVFILLTGLFFFAIQTAWAAHFNVLKPSRNAHIPVGRNYQFQWQARNISGFLKISLYDQLTELGVIADMVEISKGRYLWKAGQYSNTWVKKMKGKYRIKLESMAGPHVAESYSDYFFLEPSITVLSPAKGDAWPLGKTKTIIGIAPGYSGAVNIELWEGKRYKGRLAQGLNVINNQFRFSWKIPGPPTVELNTDYYIKATMINGEAYDLSGPFRAIISPVPVDPDLNPKTLKKKDHKNQIKLR
jgi:hypothetical protein